MSSFEVVHDFTFSFTMTGTTHYQLNINKIYFQGLINAGLLYSSAARAAFLTQTSVIMTPILSAYAGERTQPSVWGGCSLALAGLLLIATSSTAAATSAATTTTTTTATTAITYTFGDGIIGIISTLFNRGDAMILLGALSWSVYIFRTAKLARSHPALNLQFTKNLLLTLMYGGWFLVDVASSLVSADALFLTSGGEWRKDSPVSLWPGWKTSPMVWLLLAYSAIGPGVLADLLQQRGQRDVKSASESNVILCMESVFAAICGFVLLGEALSMREIAGGSLIVIAAILASR